MLWARVNRHRVLPLVAKVNTVTIQHSFQVQQSVSCRLNSQGCTPMSVEDKYLGN